MRTNATELRQRLQAYSYSTLKIISDIMAMSKDKILIMIDITTDKGLTEEQVAEKLLELKNKKDI